MRRGLRVSDQDHISGDPLFAADIREIAPDRPIGDDAMAGKLIREQAFHERAEAASSSLSSPARANVCGSVSTIQVERRGSY